MNNQDQIVCVSDSFASLELCKFGTPLLQKTSTYSRQTKPYRVKSEISGKEISTGIAICELTIRRDKPADIYSLDERARTRGNSRDSPLKKGMVNVLKSTSNKRDGSQDTLITKRKEETGLVLSKISKPRPLLYLGGVL